jgi:hypothetical protein
MPPNCLSLVRPVRSAVTAPANYVSFVRHTRQDRDTSTLGEAAYYDSVGGDTGVQFGSNEFVNTTYRSQQAGFVFVRPVLQFAGE